MRVCHCSNSATSAVISVLSVMPKRGIAQRLCGQTLDHGIHRADRRKRQLCARAAEHVLRQRDISPFRERQRVDRLAGDGFEQLAALGEIGLDRRLIIGIGLAVERQKRLAHLCVSVLKRRPLVHVKCVTLYGNQAGIHHFPRLVRAEVRRHRVVGVLVGVLADGDADGKDRRLHIVFLQDRKRILVIAEIPIIEGHTTL